MNATQVSLILAAVATLVGVVTIVRQVRRDRQLDSASAQLTNAQMAHEANEGLLNTLRDYREREVPELRRQLAESQARAETLAAKVEELEQRLDDLQDAHVQERTREREAHARELAAHRRDMDSALRRIAQLEARQPGGTP